MRQDRGVYLLEKFRIQNGVFQGIIVTREKGYTIENVSLWEKQTDTECKAASAFEINEKGQCQFLVKLADPSYIEGTWNVLLRTNQGEYLVDFPVPQSEREYNHIVSLSQTEILPEFKLHLIPAVSQDGFFALRKWHTNHSGIIKEPAYLSAIKEGEDSLVLSCKNWMNKKIRQAELVLLNKKAKTLTRLPLNGEDLAKGTVGVDFTGFLQEKNTDDIVGSVWDMYFHVNVEGTYYLSRLEHFKNKSTALNEPSKRAKLYDDSGYAFGPFSSGLHTKLYPQGTVAWRAYYDYEGRLQMTAVPKRNYFDNQFRIKVENLRIEQGNCTVTVLCPLSEFVFEELVLRSHTDPDNEDKTYHFSCLTDKEKEVPEGKICVFRRTLSDVAFEKVPMDFLLYGRKDGERYEIHLSNFQNASKFTHPKMDNFYRNQEGWFVFPVINKEDNLTLYCREIDEYDGRFIRFKEWVAECIYKVLRSYFDKKRISLFYEDFCKTAQDNAFYMYEYMMENEKVPEEIKKELFYIIDKREPDFERVKKYKFQVLNFMSIRHMVYLLAAKNLVSTSERTQAFHYKARPCKVLDHMRETPFFFLQKGVTGLMKLPGKYRKGEEEKATLVTVSSDWEKLIFEKLGYEEKEIALTGLARWDVLKDHSAGMRNILVMPTCRSWLDGVDSDTFAKSDYCRYYREFLQSQVLAEVLEAKGMTLTFVLPRKLKKYMNLFETQTERITIYDYESRPINELIMMCSLFITDYSSAAWDAYYLKKPVVFYQFDYEKYMEEQGSYINMDNLFGDRVMKPKGLFQAILTYEYNEFRERPEHIAKRERYLPDHESSHRERIYKALKPYLVDEENES